MAGTKGFDGEAYYAALARTVDAREFTWKQVSQATGVSQSTLTRMSQGKRPDAASLAALSAWSGLNPADYVEGIEETKPAEAEFSLEFAALLRAQSDLSSDAKTALESIVKTAYETLRNK